MAMFQEVVRLQRETAKSKAAARELPRTVTNSPDVVVDLASKLGVGEMACSLFHGLLTNCSRNNQGML